MVRTVSEPSVVVTGAASGIGRATVEILFDRGATVVAVDRDQAGLETLAASFKSVEVVECDVSDPTQRRQLSIGIGPIVGLVNAAGIIRLTPVDEVSVDEWRDVQQVNAEAAFFLGRDLASRIVDGGSIVNLASTAAKTGTTLEIASYAASKSAVLSITRTLAHHLAPRSITVNAVCPGVIETPMQDEVRARLAEAQGVFVDDVERRRLAAVPLGRSGSANEAAQLICWLLGAESRYITGQAINICGGLVTW